MSNKSRRNSVIDMNFNAYSVNRRNSISHKSSGRSRRGSNGNFDSNQLFDMEETIKSLEKEKTQLQSKLSQQNEILVQETKNFQKQIDDLSDQRAELMKKNVIFSKLQEGIVNLHLELQERTSEDVSISKKIIREKEELEHISPLTVLDYCRATLRILLTYKEDFVKNLHEQNDERVIQFEKQKKNYESDIFELKNSLSKSQKLIEKLKGQFEKEQNEVKSHQNSYEMLAHRIDAERQAHSNEVSELKNKILELNSANEELKRIASEAEIKGRQIEKLESELANAHAEHRTNLGKFENETKVLLWKINEESRNTQVLKVENDKLQDVIAKKDALLLSYKRNISVSLKESLESELLKAKYELTEAQNRIQELEIDLRKSKRANMTIAEKNLRLKTEFEKVNNAKSVKTRTKTSHTKQLETALGENEALKNSFDNNKKEKEELVKKVRQVASTKSNNSVAEYSKKLDRERVQKQFQKLKNNAKAVVTKNYVE
eukprot:TRINITY_DN1098_c0_g1_i1.p1 TRINITY_DN1098_c0_g1~~TRINITY_DN1098_c0_g1_i1.p1  ORF type:complete len:490 (+),score=152.26 TRINITY_DN1098_c0_g1_i1:45-1514(+)